MHNKKYGRTGLPLLLLALLLAACQSVPQRSPVTTPPPSSPPAKAPTLIWPASGELNFSSACAQSSCVHFQLSLTREHLFRWQGTGTGLTQGDLGRWQLKGKQLLLLGQGSRPLQLTLTGDNRLRFQQQPLHISDHSLFSEPDVILSELISQPERLLLAPCRTDKQWPLVNNGQYRLLQRLHASSTTQSPGPRLVLAQLHWTDDRQSLSMDRFLSLSPGHCDSP